jgi:hypothetical protein
MLGLIDKGVYGKMTLGFDLLRSELNTLRMEKYCAWIEVPKLSDK